MLRDAPVKTAMTFAEFLEFEERAQERHEFVDGNLFVMAGGTARHSDVILALTAMLRSHARKHGFQLCHDLLVQTPTGRGYYPDLYIVQSKFGQLTRVQTEPLVVIEVLSESTEAIDRGEKWHAYQQISSLEQYILLSQLEPAAEVYSRDGSTWRYQSLKDDVPLVIQCLRFELTLSELHAELTPLED